MKYLLAFAVFTLVLSCQKPRAAGEDINTGLVAFLPLDTNARDTVSHTIGQAYHTTYTNNRLNHPNSAMYFSRTDSSYVDMGDLQGASFTNGTFTIACWVNTNDTTHAIAILSKRSPVGPYEYSLDNHFGHSSFKLDNWIANGSHTVYGTDPLNAEVLITPGIWQHIAYVADGNVLSVYVNGVLSSQTDQRQSGYSFTDTDAHLVIGNGGGYGANYYFDGAISNLRMYNRALAEKDVKLLMVQ